MPDVALVLLNREGQVLAGEQLILWDHPVVALPIIGDEGLAAQADLVEQPAIGCIITPTQNPDHNVPYINVTGAPGAQLSRLFLMKRHISSTSTAPTCAGTSGTGKADACARIHVSAATLLTPSKRPIMLKLMLPMPYSNTAIAVGLPRKGVSMKLQSQPRQQWG